MFFFMFLHVFVFVCIYIRMISYVFIQKMDREGGKKRKWGNVESESLSISSPFPHSESISSSFSHSLFPFSRSQAARLPQFVQPCIVWFCISLYDFPPFCKVDIILQSMVELTHIVQRILDELPPRENKTGKNSVQSREVKTSWQQISHCWWDFLCTTRVVLNRMVKYWSNYW